MPVRTWLKICCWFMLSSFQNFVGLSVSEGYIATGSETNEVLHIPLSNYELCNVLFIAAVSFGFIQLLIRCGNVVKLFFSFSCLKNNLEGLPNVFCQSNPYKFLKLKDWLDAFTCKKKWQLSNFPINFLFFDVSFASLSHFCWQVQFYNDSLEKWWNSILTFQTDTNSMKSQEGKLGLKYRRAW